MEFLELHKKGMKTLGFWTEEFRSVVNTMMETRYNTEIIREWIIVDLIFNGDKVLIKWKKRFEPLTDKELKKEYGR